MSNSTELIINPEITAAELSNMERKLKNMLEHLGQISENIFADSFENAASTGVTNGLHHAAKKAKSKIGGGLRAGALGVGAAAVGGLVDLFSGAETTSANIDELLEQAKLNQNQSTSLGIATEENIRLKTIFRAIGVDEGEIEPLITAYGERLAEAQTDQDNLLENYTVGDPIYQPESNMTMTTADGTEIGTNSEEAQRLAQESPKYSSLESSMQGFFKKLGEIDQEDRTLYLNQVFGADAAAKIGNLVGADFESALKNAGLSQAASIENLKKITDQSKILISEKAQQDARQGIRTAEQLNSVTPSHINTQEAMLNQQQEFARQSIAAFSAQANVNMQINDLINEFRSQAVKFAPQVISFMDQTKGALNNINKAVDHAPEILGAVGDQISLDIKNLTEKVGF